jgi:DNA-binding SARP family transcriptional activator/WD40 repeat protein
MRVRVLGPLEVNEGETGLGPRDRVVLEALAARSGTPVPREHLAEALWGERVPASWPKVVQGCVARLRKALGPGSIQTTTQGYLLALHLDELDHRQFERLVSRSRDLLADGEPERAAFLAQRALNLWRGQPLTELDEWPEGHLEAERLVELHLEAQELLVEAELCSGHHDRVLPSARLLVSEQPSRERRWSLLARAEYRAGRQADALATLQRARATLVRDLGLDPGPGLTALEQAILRQESSLTIAAAPTPTADCPYPGLLPYDVDDAEAFFGRERDVEACLERLGTVSLLAVVGPSGCGKSSLVRAGLAAALTREGRDVVVIAPGRHPVSALEQARPPASAVLVVDQCEEAFVRPPDDREREAFFGALLAHAAKAPVLLALRADRVGELAAHPDVARRVEQGLYLLSAMSPDDLRRAIQGPADQAGLRLEPGLVDLLVREVEGEPGALPLLSHALRETWERREGPTLTVAGYQESGGIRGSVARSAEEVVRALPPAEQEALRELMLRLVVLDDDGEPVRTHLPRRSLPPAALHADLVERLVTARLVAADDDGLEVAHESLVRAWPRLRSWLDDDIEGLRTRRHLSVAAESWEDLGRPDSELYRGGRLERAVEWARRTSPSLTSTERGFLTASTEFHEADRRAADERARKERRLTRRLYAGLAAVAVLLAVSVVAGTVARTAADRADRQATVADARRLGAEAVGTPELDRALLLAAAGVALDDSVEMRNHLLATLARGSALVGSARASGPIFDMAFNTATGQVAAMVFDSALELYDGESLQPAAVPGALRGNGVVASPDGQGYALSMWGELVESGTEQPVVLLDRNLKRSTVQLGGLPPGFEARQDMGFSPNSRWLAVSLRHQRGEQPDVTGVWDLRSPSRPAALVEAEAHAAPTVSNDGRTLYTMGNGTLQVTDLASGRVRQVVEPTALAVRQLDDVLAQSPDGRRLAVGAGVEAVILDRATLRPQAYLSGQEGTSGLAFSSDGRHLAATGDHLVAWDVSGPDPTQVLFQDVATDHPQFSRDGQTLYTTNGEVAQAWDLSGRRRFIATEPGDPLGWGGSVVRVSPDGHRIGYAAGSPPRFRVRDVATGALSPEVVAPDLEQRRYIDIAWHPDGALLNITTGAPEVRTWDAASGREVARHRLGLPGSTEGASIAFFSVDGKYLLVGTTTGRLHVLDAHTLVPARDPIQVYPQHGGSGPRAVDSFAPSGDGRTAYLGNVVVDYLDGTVRTLPDLGYPDLGVVPSPDGRRLMANAGRAGIGLLDASTMEWISRPDATQAGLMGWMTAFSKDGSLFASTSDGDRLSYWDGRTGTYLGSAAVDVDGAPAFSADDSSLMLAGFEGSVFTWHLDPGSWVATACHLAGRELTRQEWRSYLGDRPYVRVCGR